MGSLDPSEIKKREIIGDHDRVRVESTQRAEDLDVGIAALRLAQRDGLAIHGVPFTSLLAQELGLPNSDRVQGDEEARTRLAAAQAAVETAHRKESGIAEAASRTIAFVERPEYRPDGFGTE